MPYTASDLAAVDRAIASGELEVEFVSPAGIHRTKYRSVVELKAARALIVGELSAAGAIGAPQKTGVFRFSFTTSRGD